MKRSPISTNRERAFVSTLVSAAFFWALVLSVSPHVHARVHSDANNVEHTCAVTFIASGTYEHAAPPPLVRIPAPVAEFSNTPALSPLWVPSPFLGASIFEHAPPAHS
ncbi:MAG: hypothetical protein ABI925_08260 [Verrucomicrobiota bacterium]